MSSLATPAALRRVPKVLLHDHLDGGLRPATLIELADAVGYRALPSADPEELGRWFRDAADSGSLVRYLETFAHTCAVLQDEQSLVRVAEEAVLDLADDGVVYAEVRYAPELCVERGLTLDAVVEAVQEGFRSGMAKAATFAYAETAYTQDELERGIQAIYGTAGPALVDIKVSNKRYPMSIRLRDGAHIKNRFREHLLGPKAFD